MKFFKFNFITKPESKKYLLYALGEIFLIVTGILLALFINNRNINQQYKSTIDNNVIRVFDELEKNIERTRANIEELCKVDSLIHLVMTDSLNTADYYENIDLAFLITDSHRLTIVETAYQNLIRLNVSDNRYREELLTRVKELYSLNPVLERLNERMTDFVIEEAVPLFAKNIPSFGDLTYAKTVQEDAVDFYLTSTEYKSYVGQYSIIAINNLLKTNESFYKKAIDVYNQISRLYDLKNKYTVLFGQSPILEYQGVYINELTNSDTLEIKIENDSLFVIRKDDFKVSLVQTQSNRFFMNNHGDRYFVSFYGNDTVGSKWKMQTHILAHRATYRRLND